MNLNRFTRCYNIVGNILGKKGYTWQYEVEMTGFSYGKHYFAQRPVLWGKRGKSGYGLIGRSDELCLWVATGCSRHRV